MSGVEVTSGAHPAPYIRLVGELDGSATGAVLDAYGTLRSPHSDEVLLDLHDVAYLDSSGLALVVQLLGLVRADGRRLRVAGLSPHFREIFAITRLDEHVVMNADTAAARADQRS